jgi:hypothetical protein
MSVCRAGARRRFTVVLGLAALLTTASPVRARVEDPLPADKAHVLDGSAALTVGRLHVNITNWGLIGSRYSEISTYGDAPSGQWPGGSGNEYLFAAGLWIGGMVNGAPHVSTGQPEAELRPADDPRATLYEAREGLLVRPPNPGAGGVPWYLPGGDDDGDGRLDEEVLDGVDNDGDGRVDEDFGQVGTQMFDAMMRDDTPLALQSYPDHRPLHVEVQQRAVAWQTSEQQDFIGLSYHITNAGTLGIQELYLGFWVDADIGPRTDPDGSSNDLAGSFDGYVRVPAGHFQPVRGAYMRDASPINPLPGWFGVQLIGHTTDQDRVHAPYPEGLHGVRIISSTGVIHGDDPPMNDEERYELLSRPGREPDVTPDLAADYSVLISCGPFPRLEPGESLDFEVALCVGEGLEDLRRVCAAAQDARFGRWIDADADAATGSGNRETLVCAEDFYPQWSSPLNPIFVRNSSVWNLQCVSGMIMPNIIPSSLTWNEALGKHCMYVNLDNCEECERANGRSCLIDKGAASDFAGAKASVAGAYTGVGGRETQAPWVVQVMPPPAPSVRLVPGDGVVHLFWDDRSEWALDEVTGRVDFESYRLWRSDLWDRPPGSSLLTGPSRDSWRLMAEYDLVNQYQVTYPGGQTQLLDLGQNTGLEVAAYRPVCLDDPRFLGLADAMRLVVESDAEGRFTYLPPLRDIVGNPVPGLEPLLPWQEHAVVLDTFFALTPRAEAPGVAPKRAVRYYSFDDANVDNGFLYFYAVTATDHTSSASGQVITGFGVQGTPGAVSRPATPRYQAVPTQSPENTVFVYPNPATRERLDEFQSMHPDRNDPTGVRVVFANLPATRCTIDVFTLAGDLVITIDHDGSDGTGQASWNLVSRNLQEVVSGIYLFVVTPHAPGFSRSTGKFVVIR